MHAIDGMACAKRGCDNRGKLGLNIVGHGSFPTKWGRRWRYRCTVCGRTVSTHTGTAYSGLRCARRECDQVASLRVEGVSISATARVTGHARHTIARWLERVSTAAKRREWPWHPEARPAVGATDSPPHHHARHPLRPVLRQRDRGDRRGKNGADVRRHGSDPQYIHVTRTRWEAFTGQRARALPARRRATGGSDA